MRALALAVAAVAVWALAGCTAPATSPPPPNAATAPPRPSAGAGPMAPHTVVFACETGDTLTVTFAEGAASVVDAQGRSFHLAQQETGSGIDYQGAGHELRGKGQEATWTGPDGTPVMCSAAHSPLVGTRWELVELQSSDKNVGTVRPADPSKFTMDLMAGGRLAMQLDCNRAAGAWEAHATSATEGALTLGEPAMTRAMCPTGAMDSQVASQLGRVRTYKLEGERLILGLEANAGAYTWRRAAP